MTKLESILFESGDFNEKKAYIENMTMDELISVDKSVVKDIIEKCSPNNKRFWIDGDRRKGNGWNSLVEEVSYLNGNVFVGIYVQNTKTDTSTSEYFDVFFRRGQYVSSDNNINERVRYDDKEKAEVMRSILLDCVYWLYNAEIQRKKLVAKLKNYKILNPIYDYFFSNYFRLGNLPFSYATTKPEYKRYCNGKDAVEQYVDEHAEELNGKTDEQLKAIYMEVFKKSVFV